MKNMQELPKESIVNANVLQNSLADNGYIFIRNFFDPDTISVVSSKVNDVLVRKDWGVRQGNRIKPNQNVHRLGGDEYCDCISEMMGIEDIHRLPNITGLNDLISTILDAEAYLHPRKIIRITYPYEDNPNDLVTPHQDIVYVKGEVDTLVAWIPLADYTSNFGPLKIANASHKYGLLPTKKNEEGRFGCTASNLDDLQIDWRTTDYRMGDLLIMHSMLMHASLPNLSDTFRTSFDCRFSEINKSINIEQLYPPYYPRIKNWNEITPNMTELMNVPITLCIEDAMIPLERIISKRSNFI